MGIAEVSTWQVSCDRCPNVGPTITQRFSPPTPPEWSWSQQHNCGLTNYTRNVLLCPMCTERAQREAVANSQVQPQENA